MSRNSIAQKCSLCGHQRSQPRRKSNYGLPGPNPPRNKAGGFKVVGLGAMERSGPSGITGATVQDRTCPDSPCKHSFPNPATFIPQWVKFAVILAQAA